MKQTAIILVLLVFFGCSPTKEPSLTRYLTYTDSVNDYLDTVVYTFSGWPPSFDSLEFDKGVLHVVDSQKFISIADTFSIYKYRLLKSENTDTSYYFFHHTFSYHRHLVFIQEPSLVQNQLIVDTLQYKQHKPLYEIIENDTSGFFLNSDMEITSRLSYQGVFL